MPKKKPDIPVFDTPIIETHCHLDYLEEQLNDVLEAASKVNIEKIITIAVSPDNLSKVINIAEQFENIFTTQGIHPHDAQHYNDDIEAQIKEGLQHEKVLAVGEIGLDYYYDNSPRKQQIEAFERQLALAVEYELPIVVHTRDADEDTQAVLANFSNHLQRKGVIHSFTSGKALAEYCLGEGFYLGFNGISTFNKAENVREIIGLTPIEQILLETDSPYLTPVPYRGKTNEPKYLPFIAQQVADCKEIPVEQLLLQAYSNSLNCFWR